MIPEQNLEQPAPVVVGQCEFCDGEIQIEARECAGCERQACSICADDFRYCDICNQRFCDECIEATEPLTVCGKCLGEMNKWWDARKLVLDSLWHIHNKTECSYTRGYAGTLLITLDKEPK